MAVPVSNPFDLLPIETNQHIASHLDDSALCVYRLICQSTHDAVDADRCSFWRRRFLATFEKPSSGLDNIKYKQAYQKRRKTLRYGPKFNAALTRRDPGQIRKGTEALEVLRDLITDAFSEKKGEDDTIYESPNLEAIIKFANEQDLLDVIFVPISERRNTRASRDVLCIPKQLLITMQVLLAPAMFDTERAANNTFDFPTSQQIAYGTATEHPIFDGANGLDINMEWVLHQLNFWKYHMCREAESTLNPAFEELEEDEKPRFWDGQLEQGANKLGAHWKGAYAFVDRNVIPKIRAGKGHKDIINDEFSGEGTGSFQDMRLEFVDDDAVQWPPEFERHLQSLAAPPSRAKTRAQRRSATPDGLAAFKPVNFQFTGEGSDATEEFLAQGWLNALPPQYGVPGWQRMTMMKYFEDPNTGAIDYDALWAYEGVVLPGGQIMVGRWWAPTENHHEEAYSGPYILWCVDGPQHAQMQEEEEEADDEDDVAW